MMVNRRARVALTVLVAGALPLAGLGAAAVGGAGFGAAGAAQAAPNPAAPGAAQSSTARSSTARPDAPQAHAAIDTADEQLALSRLVREAAEEAAAQPRTRAQSGSTEVAAGLDEAVTGVVDEGAVGVTARVESPDLDWTGADGVRELDGHVPARPTDRFRVASITKPMVATLVMQEVEKGTWTLGTSVEDVVPGALPRDVTIGQLLSHTSGAATASDYLLAEHMSDPADIDEFIEVQGDHYSEAEHVKAAHDAPWVLEPGTGFSYSNAGYVTLGMMLEKETGEDLDDLLEERVFEPAGMRHSDYPERSGTHGPFMDGAAFTGDQGDGWYSTEHFDPTVFRAAGAATSTTADLAAFTEALVVGDLVEPATVTDMLTPRSTDVLEYGLGTYRIPDPCLPGEYLYGHDGATWGTLSVALTSLDGTRQVSLGLTGRNISTDPEALYALDDLLVPMLEATC